MHQYTTNKLNRFTNSAIIGADVCTHLPPTQTIFYHNLLLLYLDIYLYMRQTKIHKLTDIITPYTYSKCI